MNEQRYPTKSFCTLAAIVFGLLLGRGDAAPAQQHEVRVATTDSVVANHPAATVSLPAPYKVVGGGVRANWTHNGSLLTESRPAGPGLWAGSAKDHIVADRATLSVFAIGLDDPQDVWEVAIFEARSTVAQHPTMTASVPQGFAMTGGGCVVDWKTAAGAAGNLLTASYPASTSTWECRSKDHGDASPASITAYAIGIRPKVAGASLPTTQISRASSAEAAHPSAVARALDGFVVTGGGARALPTDPNGAGQLLTASAPEIAAGSRSPIGWRADSKDHVYSSPGTVEAFAVNLKFAPSTAPVVVAEPVAGPVGGIKVSTKQSFALTAKALSPFAVTLDWDAVANAVGYTVLRDGVAIAQLADSARAYRDDSLTPGSLRKYQVQATIAQPPLRIFPNSAPDVPSTPVVEIQTPAVLPPSGIVVKVVGQSSVEVSWQLRHGAADYALLKDGTTISIGPQPQPGVYVLNNVAQGTSSYALRTIYRKPDGSQVLSEPGPTVSLRTGPLRVLAIGDSIMWGQGLSDASKFKTKVGQWIADQLGRQVDVTLLARSGAELTPAAQTEGQNAPAYFAHGEVPHSRPSIRDQGLALGPQRVPSPRDVDLILVDGCINDVNIRTLLDPRIQASQIHARTVGACGTPMLSLLLELARKYENSKIIVTGYYPIVSAYSDLTALTALATHVGALAGYLSPAAAALVGIPIDPLTGAIIGAVSGVIASDQYKRHCITSSDLFAAVSTNELLTAAVSVNNTLPGNRIEFVPAPFGPTNAYAAPNTFLWLVPTAPIAQDEVYAERFEACRVVPAGVDNVLCVEASMGHPNVRGAQAYADAITGRLGRFLPEWRARFAPAQMAQ